MCRTWPDNAFIARTTLRNSRVRGSASVTNRRAPIASAWFTISPSGRVIERKISVPITPHNTAPIRNHSSMRKFPRHKASYAKRLLLTTASVPYWRQLSCTCAMPGSVFSGISLTNHAGTLLEVASLTRSTITLPEGEVSLICW